MNRICLVGAGNISRVHADAVRTLPGTTIAAIVDPNAAAAQRLAAASGGGAIFASVQDALGAGGFDRAHVLVPPQLHAVTAEVLLRAGKPVLMEKPLATDAAECGGLLAAATAGAAALGVNQNFVHHPAFVRLKQMVDTRTFGQPRFSNCIYNVPLRQMQGRQFGHWMFHAPVNILLEQAVHPLSQIVALAGPIADVRALAGEPVEVAPGLPLYPTLSATLFCRDLPAQLRFAVGQDFPFWQVTVVCDDGVVVADILANRVVTYSRTRYLDAVDNMTSGLRSAAGLARDSISGLSNYALSTLKLKGRSDPFFRSMAGSIAAFHAAVDAGQPPELDGAFGAHLVDVCEALRDQAFGTPTVSAPVVPAPTVPAKPATAGEIDVTILGGTGFIGTHTVRRFVDAGLRVLVMARTARNLPAIFNHPQVVLHRGDVGDVAAVACAVGDAPVVVNLAHGGGGATWEDIRRSMVDSAEMVARACLQRGVRRLVHVGSIASLYLGPQPTPVTGATLPDPEDAKRGDYARAKVLCDRMLTEMHVRESLPVVILRPGVVVGNGSSPFHSGVGMFNNDQHCIGWNAGHNALPFVLVEDVAEAILLATRAEGIEGCSYNLVGDVRPTAREYILDLGHALSRPLCFHPQSPRKLWLADLAKWAVKRATGRRVPVPNIRDFVSRGMRATLDCTDAQHALGWTPVSDPKHFHTQAIQVHAR